MLIARPDSRKFIWPGCLDVAKYKYSSKESFHFCKVLVKKNRFMAAVCSWKSEAKHFNELNFNFVLC